jgi:hypothetical protein
MFALALGRGGAVRRCVRAKRWSEGPLAHRERHCYPEPSTTSLGGSRERRRGRGADCLADLRHRGRSAMMRVAVEPAVERWARRPRFRAM